MTEAFVKNHPIFSHLPPEDLEMILKLSICLEKKEGEKIFQQGDPTRDLYLIQEGKVLITRETEDRETIELATLKEGDFFGEMELLAPTQNGRAASAQALTPAKLVLFPAERFMTCLNQTDCGRRMLFFFCRLLIHRLRQMDEAYSKLFLEYRGKKHISELKRFREKLTREWGF